MAEQLCILGLRLWRQGEPIQDVDTSVAIPDLTWRLNPLVAEGYPTIVYADGDSAKSLVALVEGLAVHRGHPSVRSWV